MTDNSIDQRKTRRYDHEMDVNFSYDMKARIKVSVEEESISIADKKFGGLSKNVSVEGMCFTSHKKLQEGVAVHLEVYLPQVRDHIFLDGEVRWSRAIDDETDKSVDLFDTGVKLNLINGQPIHDSIYYDKEYHVAWSAVLESILGGFRIAMQRQ